MDAAQRTRRCCRTRIVQKSQRIQGAKQICVAMSRQVYDRIWSDPQAVRAWIDARFEECPELFPQPMKGYRLTGHLPPSAKLPGIRLRQLRLKNGEVYTLRPSFVLPYMTGFTNEIEYPLRLLARGVPPWLIAEYFGHSANYWDRQLERLGRNSLVGTTVRDPARLPQHLAADEHHSYWSGEKAYVAMTVGEGCILGISLTNSAGDAPLTEAYNTFAQEAREVDPHYTPETVNTDGWPSTQNAWRAMFPLVTLIRCFLHGFLKIRDRCGKAHAWHERVWDVYRAATEEDFRSRMASFREWVEAQSLPAAVHKAMAKLWGRSEEYVKAYAHPGCRRTSNMVDRLTNGLYRNLYAHRGMHGHHTSSERRLRGWALLHNFCPFAPRAGQTREYTSPAHRLNQKQYSPCWLQNLMLSASMCGQKPQT